MKAATEIDMSQYEIMEKLARQVDQENSLVVSTTFKGTRTHPQKLGTISYISEDNFLPEFFILGFMEGMVRELYDMYLKMKKVSHREMSTMMVSGNAIRQNSTLRTICEKRFLLPSILAKYEEEVACGATMSILYIKDI